MYIGDGVRGIASLVPSNNATERNDMPTAKAFHAIKVTIVVVVIRLITLDSTARCSKNLGGRKTSNSPKWVEKIIHISAPPIIPATTVRKGSSIGYYLDSCTAGVGLTR